MGSRELRYAVASAGIPELQCKARDDHGAMGVAALRKEGRMYILLGKASLELYRPEWSCWVPRSLAIICGSLDLYCCMVILSLLEFAPKSSQPLNGLVRC